MLTAHFLSQSGPVCLRWWDKSRLYTSHSFLRFGLFGSLSVGVWSFCYLQRFLFFVKSTTTALFFFYFIWVKSCTYPDMPKNKWCIMQKKWQMVVIKPVISAAATSDCLFATTLHFIITLPGEFWQAVADFDFWSFDLIHYNPMTDWKCVLLEVGRMATAYFTVEISVIWILLKLGFPGSNIEN